MRVHIPVLVVCFVVGLILASLGRSAPGDQAKSVADADAKKEMQARLLTLNEKAIPLSQALKDVLKQTGTELEDRREDKGDDPKLRLKLTKATYWQAVDAIAKEADLRVLLDSREGKVGLVGGPYREIPTSYSGIFRITLRRLTMVRQFDAGEESNSQYCIAHMQVAWEPRFQPFLISTQPESLVVHDDKGRNLEMQDGDRGQAPVSGKLALELPVHLPAPPRSAGKFGLIQGTFNVFGAGKMLTFTFSKLDDKKTKGETKTLEGVTCKIIELKTEEEPWTVGLSLKYPDNPKLESFQSYLISNEAFLEDANGKRWAANGGSETDQNQLTTRHFWVEEGDKKLGKPGDWKLVYRTPGQMIELPVKFGFKDVPLP